MKAILALVCFCSLSSAAFCEPPGRFQLFNATDGYTKYVLKIDTATGDTWLLDGRMASHGDGSFTRLQAWVPIAKTFGDALDAARKEGPTVVPFNPK